MKKEDHNQLSKEQLIEESFESTKYDSWAKQDPLTARHAAAKELINIKQQQHERIKTAEETAKEI